MTNEETTSADSEYRLNAGLKRLLPCPFCGGGETQIQENGRIWTGMKWGAPTSVSVWHWCEELAGPKRMLERVGRDLEQAIERWNMRSNAELPGREPQN